MFHSQQTTCSHLTSLQQSQPMVKLRFSGHLEEFSKIQQSLQHCTALMETMETAL
jgi:acetylglutamate synthase